jgi:hypothetical protein
LIIEVVAQGTVSSGVTDAELNGWVEAYENIPIIVRDAPGHEGESLSALTIRETLLIVEIPAMQIVYLDRGDVSGATASSAIDGLTELERLLSAAP